MTKPRPKPPTPELRAPFRQGHPMYFRSRHLCSDCIYFDKTPEGTRCFFERGKEIEVSPSRPQCKYFRKNNDAEQANESTDKKD